MTLIRNHLHSAFIVLPLLLLHSSCAHTPSDVDPMLFGTLNATAGGKLEDPFIYRPPQVPLDAEAYPIAPQGLELQQVHVYVRHGERTPVGVRLAEPPASIPEHWMMCKHARLFQTAVNGHSGMDYVHIQKGVERGDGSMVEGQCLLGELTDTGRQSTNNFGKSLRKLYINRLGFLPDVLHDPREVYLRTTNMPRTTESLQQVIHGLYPSSKCDAGARPTILVRNGKDENLLGNTHSCKRLEILQLGFAHAAAVAHNPILAQLDKKMTKYTRGGIRVDGKPRASGIMDTVRAAIAHGINVPPEFKDPSVVDVIERAIISEWFEDKTEEGRRLGMGRLLDDLTRKMNTKVTKGGDDPLKLLVHSTHDTALAALCTTLDVFDDKWPAFTASITFELFKAQPQNEAPRSQGILSALRNDKASEYYVRMRYQNQDMKLLACAEVGKHLAGSPEFCTLSAFRERVKELTPVDWGAECAPSGAGRRTP